MTNRIGIMLAFAVPVLLLSVASLAADDERLNEDQNAPLAVDESSVDASGLVIVRDAETGEIRTPTADEMAQLTESASAIQSPDEQLIEFRGPGNTRGVYVGKRFMNTTVVHRNAETGEMDYHCSEGDHDHGTHQTAGDVQ